MQLSNRKKLRKQKELHLMMIPSIVLAIIFSYIPMYGIVIAFQKFLPTKGLFGSQQWVGLDNFKYLFSLPNTAGIIWNTLFIAIFKIIGLIVFPVITAIMLNEIKNSKLRRSLQTVVSFPHFISWIILASIFNHFLSGDGMVNNLLTKVGLPSVGFLTDASVFPWTIIVTDIWKELGFSSIIYLAALTNVDQQLYEAAHIDGANHFQCIAHITIPEISSVIFLMSLLSLGNLLNAGFDQVYNMYNTMVMSTGDIIDTFIYRVGLLGFKYGPGTAMGLFKSLITCILISVSYFLAYKLADYRIF